MVETTPRVVVLARPGKAAENLADALRQAGADLIAVIDPSGLDRAGLLAHRPQAVLVALEPGIEASVDALDDVLSSPELTVIFDEADVAAQRAGWDAARWVRHLAAKLHRHSDVLPPGAEPETDMVPTPGPFPTPASMHAARLDIAPFAREAEGRAGSVPADELRPDRAHETAPQVGSPDAPVEAPPQAPHPAPTASPASTLALDDDAFFLETLSSNAAATPARDVDADFGGFDLSLAPLDGEEADDGSPAGDGIRFDLDDAAGFAEEIDAGALNEDELRAFEQAMRASAQGNPGAAREHEPPAFDPTLLQDLGFDPALLEPIQPDSSQASSAQAGPTRPGSVDRDAFELPASAADDLRAAFDVDLSRGDSPATTPGEAPLPRTTPSVGLPDFSSLSLADDDAAPLSSAPAAAAAPPRHNLSDLEHRISGLSLVDIEPSDDDDPQSGPSAEKPPLRAYDDIAEPVAPTAPTAAAPVPDPIHAALASVPVAPPVPAPAMQPPAMPPPLPTYQAPPVPATPAPATQAVAAVVLVEAGLGGPDPVRQLLAGLPAHFRIPVVVRLQLQGGRYDRLVAQMERAAVLPIALASPDQPLLPGRIHFLPDGVGLRRDGAGLRFDIAFAGPDGLYDTLETLDDGALVFLSGSEPALVDRAASLAAGGALVIAQSPEDCYDGVACAQLRSRGVPVAAASDLAVRLAQHWPH